MTRMHFEALAEALKAVRPDDDHDAQIQWNKDIKAVADACRRFCPGFKLDRFIEACGGLC